MDCRWAVEGDKELAETCGGQFGRSSPESQTVAGDGGGKAIRGGEGYRLDEMGVDQGLGEGKTEAGSGKEPFCLVDDALHQLHGHVPWR